MGEGSPPGTAVRRRWLRLVEWGAAATVGLFLMLNVVSGWSQIAAYPWQIGWGRLALASALVAVAYSGFALLWRRLLALLGGHLSVIDAQRVWYLGNLARYVPGKVWQLAGMAYLGRSKGVSPVSTITASIAAQLFVLAGGLILAALTLPSATARVAGNLRLIGVTAAVLLLMLLFTPALGIVYRAGLRLARRSEYYTYIPWRERVVLLLGHVVAWLALGTGFYLFLIATTDVPGDALGPVLGICAAGYVAGWLVVFVPGGLGVREGAYALLLTLYLPTAVAAAVALLSRLWLTACELGVAAFLVLRYGVSDLRSESGSEDREWRRSG